MWKCIIHRRRSCMLPLVLLLVLLVFWGRLPASDQLLLQRLLARWRLPVLCPRVQFLAVMVTRVLAVPHQWMGLPCSRMFVLQQVAGHALARRVAALGS